MQAPGDVAVGYSNLNGAVFNLLRDDLGTIKDRLTLNYESAFTRGVVEGEYTVNLHLFRLGDGTLPIPVTVVVSSRPEGGYNSRIFSTDVLLRFVDEEVTVVRFALDEDGTLVPGSINNGFRALRIAGK